MKFRRVDRVGGQTVSDSRPIGFQGIAVREEGTKRQREKGVGGRPSGVWGPRGGTLLIVATLARRVESPRLGENPICQAICPATKFKSQSAFRLVCGRWRTRGRPFGRRRRRVLAPEGIQSGFG